MIILAVECSAKPCSAVLWRDGALLAGVRQNKGLTHSQTLLPMLMDMLKNSGLTLGDVDRFAISRGPGSFTGLRIGIATVQGMAFAQDAPCCGVSTLEAMAQPAGHMGMTVCCVMDARAGQVYNAIFDPAGDGTLRRRCEDRALAVTQLAEEMKTEKSPLLVVGDGARLCYNSFTEMGISAVIVPEHLRWQDAWGVAELAARQDEREWVTAQKLQPVYLRLPQAERERRARLEQDAAASK